MSGKSTIILLSLFVNFAYSQKIELLESENSLSLYQ